MTSGQGAAGIPVPGDDDDVRMPDTKTIANLPWNSIPKFVPGTTNVQEYCEKLQFISQIWPVEFLDQLAPRAALLIEGTAFKKVSRISPELLKVKNTSGIALIVKALGGAWGQTELEERYEYYERALYGTIQKPDESNDSYLSRSDAHFEDLLSRKTSLEEIRAYVVLRQSTLSHDDKKRIILEQKGKLDYEEVAKAIRLLGSRFFAEVQGAKAAKTKVYDVNLADIDHDVPPPSPFPSSEVEIPANMAMNEEFEVETETFEALIAAEDPDALLIQSFEHELEDFMQDTPELHTALLSYTEARQRLADKRKTRGFWPASPGKGKFKGGGKGYKGGGKGKGSKRGSLLDRIARSQCKICLNYGHWKAECPQRAASSGANEKITKEASANVATIPSANLQDLEVLTEKDIISMFDMPDATDDVVRQDRDMPCACESILLSQVVSLNKSHGTNLVQRFQKIVESKDPQNRSRKIPLCRSEETLPCLHVDHHTVPNASFAILDTGASRCVIGTKNLEKFMLQMPEQLRSHVKNMPSSVRFRFGNNQSLTSEKRVLLPLQSSVTSNSLWLAIEVVPGYTPFLFSKRAFKLLGGVLDSRTDRCILHRLQKEQQLQCNPSELYLLDVIQLCTTDKGPQVQVSETQCTGNLPPEFIGMSAKIAAEHTEPSGVKPEFSFTRHSGRFPNVSFKHADSCRSRSDASPSGGCGHAGTCSPAPEHDATVEQSQFGTGSIRGRSERVCQSVPSHDDGDAKSTTSPADFEQSPCRTAGNCYVQDQAQGAVIQEDLKVHDKCQVLERDRGRRFRRATSFRTSRSIHSCRETDKQHQSQVQAHQANTRK